MSITMVYLNFYAQYRGINITAVYVYPLHMLLCITTYTQSQVNDFLGISLRTNVALKCRSGHDPLAFMASDEQAVEICLWKTMFVQTHEPHI